MVLKIAVISLLIAVSLGRKSLPDATDGEFLNDCLTSHNAKRALHKNTLPLELDKALNKYAKQRCSVVTQQKELDEDHNGLNRDVYGENLDWKADSDDSKKTCSQAVHEWYSEIKYYDYKNPGENPDGKAIGHFTQLVWKSAKKVGCARSYGYSSTTKEWETYVCCVYKPPFVAEIDDQSQYPLNVQPLKQNSKSINSKSKKFKG